MPGHEQVNYAPERATERSAVNFTPQFQPMEMASLRTDQQQQTPLTITDNKMTVPPINAAGWDATRDAFNGLLQQNNPYQSWNNGILQRAPDGAVQLASDRALGTASTASDGAEREGVRPQSLGPGDVHGQKILDAAKAAVDQKVWQSTGFADRVDNGRLGSAASVSKLLQGLGYDYANSANVSNLTSSMIANGWQRVELNQARPGDIIFGGKQGTDWKAGGGNAHVGIVGENGKVYHNQPNTGQFKLDTQNDTFPPQQYGDQIWVLRPPSQGPQAPRAIPQEGGRADAAASAEAGQRRAVNWRRGNPEAGRPYESQVQQERRGHHQSGYDATTPPDGQTDSLNPLLHQASARRGDFNPLRILGEAVKGVGEALWAMTPFRNSVRNGRLGCAASVSHVLQNAGYRYANHAGVGGLDGQLRQNGWQRAPISQAAPGDVVVIGRTAGWRNGGGAAHVGIVGENGSVYHNSSRQGRWVRDNLNTRFRGGSELFVLKPPENGRHEIPQTDLARGPRFDPEPRVITPERRDRTPTRTDDDGLSRLERTRRRRASQRH